MYGNDGQKKDTLKGKDSRFHDIIHNVNNDGLEDMAWPGALARQRDNRTKGKEEERSAKTTQTQTTTQTQEKPSDSSPKSKPVAKVAEIKPSKPAKVETNKEGKTVSDNQQPKSKSSQRHDIAKRQDIIITDEWSDFQYCLDNYDSREEGAGRHSIYLPDKVYNTYQTVFSRDMSAAISVILQRFIDRNKSKMLAVINRKSDLLK